MPKQLDSGRRRFFGTAVMTIAAAQQVLNGPADGQLGKTKAGDLPKIGRGEHTSFASLKHIDAGVLNVGSAEAGPPGSLWSSFCTAGLTTFTAMLTSRLCCQPQATA
jgi:hypothetical protein